MKWLFVILLSLLAAGCASKKQSAFDGVSPVFPAASKQIAYDAAKHLAAIYPPGQTTIMVDAQSVFGEALENALRQRGFTVSSAGVPIEYQLDMLQGEAAPSCYLSLHLPEGSITQSYSLTGGLVVADSNFSKTGLPSYGGIVPGPENVESTPLTPAAPIVPVVNDIPLPPPPVVQAALPPPPVPAIKGEPPLGTPAVSSSPKIEAALAEVQASASPVTLAMTPVTTMPVLAPEVVPPVALDLALPALPVETAWEIKPGMLRPQVERWAMEAGYQIIWKAEHDYDMQSAVQFRDDFLGAIRRLFTRLHLHGNPLRVTVYQDNNVIEVVED